MAAKKRGGAKRGKKRGAKKSAKRGAKRGAKRSAKKSSRRKKAKRTGAKRTPNAAFMKPMQPSEQLSTVVGSGMMPRTEVTKKLWQYIKRKGLQDSKNRRMINADENLRPIFKTGQVSMFDMTKLVNKHLS
jgi:upstream activation factor subunit UAF30